MPKAKGKKLRKFSQGEQDLYRTAKNILSRRETLSIQEAQQAKEALDNKFKQTLSTTLPKPKIVWEVEDASI